MKAEILRAMDSIYALAYVTIMAASGSSAESGLPGVRKGSRCGQSSIHILPDMHLALSMTMEDCMKNSVYIKRGWTYVYQ